LGEAALRDAADAAAGHDFEAAYHFLMAALHIADKAADFPMVDAVSGRARQYGNAIDAMRPEHPLSTVAATRRGTTPLFEAVQIHAKAVLARHRARSKRQKVAERRA